MLAEGWNKSALMIAELELSEKLGNALVSDMLRDIDLLLELLDSLIVAIVSFFAERIFFVAAAATAARSQEPGQHVLVEAVEVIASLYHSVVENLKRLLARICPLFVIIRRLGRGRVDAAYQRRLELKVLVGPNQYSEKSPDDGCKSADESEIEV